RTEELRKAVEEARLAREAAKAAEEKRVAAIKAAEEATKAANEAITLKRDSERHSDTTKVAALPTLEMQRGDFDGWWRIGWKAVFGCKPKSNSYALQVANGTIEGRVRNGNITGSVSASGTARWTVPSMTDGAPLHCSGVFRGNGGSGRCSRVDGKCVNDFVA